MSASNAQLAEIVDGMADILALLRNGERVEIHEEDIASLRDAAQRLSNRSTSAEETLFDLRRDGWCVAVHNDYTLDGKDMTFWLFTHPVSGRFVKGEGETDAAALRAALEAAKAEREEPKP